MNNYGLQIINVCRQTFFNIYGVFPDTEELIDMIGREYTELVESLYGKALKIA